MSLATRGWVFWGGLWLALATVLAFALDPFSGSAVRETPGSAFSFFTSDVSLGPSRAPAPDRLVRASVAADPGANVRDLTALPARAIEAPIAAAPGASPSSRPGADPPARVAGGPFRARAPPRA